MDTNDKISKATRAGGHADDHRRCVAPAFSILEQVMVSKSERWTNVPAAWSGHRLYDWGRKGLRSTGNIYVRAAGHRPRKTFDFHVGTHAFAYLTVPTNQKVLYRVKALAGDEVWPVYVRAGKFWKRDHYIVPAAALAEAITQIEAGV